MSLVLRQSWNIACTESRLFLREPVAATSTVLLPLSLLIIVGVIYGNKPNPGFNGNGAVDVFIPAYATVVISISGFSALTGDLAIYREQGILRRLLASPLRPGALFLGKLCEFLAIQSVGVALLVCVGMALFGARLPGARLWVVPALLLTGIAFLAQGFAVAALAKTSRLAQAVGNLALLPMLLLSGAMIPFETFPDGLKVVSQVLPLTHAVKMLRGLWGDNDAGQYAGDAAYLVVTAIACLLLGLKQKYWKAD